jgi:C4-dicarboxylate-specific signal transduction histidine kinase
LNPEQEKSQVSALASEVYNTGLLTGDAVAATIAHEVKQPLSGMITNADAGLRWLDRSTPDLDKAKAAIRRTSDIWHILDVDLSTNVRFARRPLTCMRLEAVAEVSVQLTPVS